MFKWSESVESVSQFVCQSTHLSIHSSRYCLFPQNQNGAGQDDGGVRDDPGEGGGEGGGGDHLPLHRRPQGQKPQAARSQVRQRHP